jgi:hypothetical protein
MHQLDSGRTFWEAASLNSHFLEERLFWKPGIEEFEIEVGS